MNEVNQAAERLRRWRHATIDDIGSIARFGDTTHKHEPWEYGILDSIQSEQDSPTGNAFVWYDSEGEERLSYVCQIQADSPIDNDEPITEEWWAGFTGRPRKPCVYLDSNRLVSRSIGCGCEIESADCAIELPEIRTRGQIRSLLRTLGSLQ